MQLNVGNGLFPGLNDQEGIMICGYEWGYSKRDQLHSANGIKQLGSGEKIEVPFSSKFQHFGDRALTWRYDQRLIKWFKIWGHELKSPASGSFEKTIVQTNWCDTENNSIEGDYWNKLLAEDQIKNFIFHIEKLRPKLIIFCGSQLIKCLQVKKVIDPFISIVGPITRPLQFQQKIFTGRRFKIGFQSHAGCDIVSLPHPSSSRGLSDDYIALFSDEIGQKIQTIKMAKGI